MPYIETPSYRKGYGDGSIGGIHRDLLKSDYDRGYQAGIKASMPYIESDYDKGFKAGQRDQVKLNPSFDKKENNLTPSGTHDFSFYVA